MRKTALIFIISFAVLLSGMASVANAQYLQPNLWRIINGYLSPLQTTIGLQIPSLAGNNCIGTDGSGNFGAGTCTGGAGGSSTVIKSASLPYLTFSNLAGGIQTGTLASVLSLVSSTDIQVSASTGTSITFTFLNPKGFTTTTIAAVLQSISATSPITYNSSTGAIGWTNSFGYISAAVTSINGDTTAAQRITSTGPITTSTSAGVTTIGCATCLTANQSITVTATGEATGTGSGTTSITLPLVLKSPVTENVSTTQVTTTALTVTGVKNALELGDANGNFTAFAGSSCSYGYISTGDIATGTMVCVPASSTDIIYVDGNRTDTYTQNGSYLYPFKTVSGALTAVQAVSSSYSGFAFILAPTTYVDGAPDTFPTQPFIIQGNEATLVEPSGATLPGSFDIYDLTGVGTFTESDNSLTFIHQWNNSAIVGSISLAGNATLEGMAFPSTTSTITALAGSLVGITGSFMQGTIISSGTLNITNSAINASSTNWALLSTAGSVNMNGVSLLNLGLGGGIKISNGATSTPNNLAAVSVTVNSSTAGSAITAGTATTILCGIDGLTNLTGTFIPPTGSAFQACYDEARSVLSGLGVGTSTIPSTGIIDSDIAPNSFIATDANRHLIATTTPTGGAGSVTTSTPLTSGQVVIGTGGTSIGTDSSFVVNTSTPNVTLGTSTAQSDLFDIINASGTNVMKVSTTTNPTSSFVAFNVKGNPSSTATTTLLNLYQILSSGHVNSTGTLPSMGTCGSSPSVIGTDSWGTITVGSGVVTSCAMNFAIPYETSNIACVESDNSTAVTGDITSITSSTVTFGFSATLGGGKVFYMCGENQ